MFCESIFSHRHDVGMFLHHGQSRPILKNRCPRWRRVLTSVGVKMLILRNEVAIGRLLREAIDGRLFLQGFSPIARHRMPFALTLRSTSSNVGRWKKVYEDFVGSEKLSRLQDNIFVVESDCLRSQNIRLQYQQKLFAAQTQLKDLHSELRNVSTVDKRYPELIAEELRILKQVRALSYDFHLVDEAEKENFLLYERTLAAGQKEEWTKAKRSHRFLVYASLIGFIVGIAGTLVSIYLHSYLYEDPALKSNRIVQNLVTELAYLIHSKNIVIQAFLQDAAILLDSLPSHLIHDDKVLPLPLKTDDDQFSLTQLALMVPLFTRKNEENGEEMARLLHNWHTARDKQQVSNIRPSEEQEAKTVPDLALLWRTTFFYSLLVVGVPLVYTLVS